MGVDMLNKLIPFGDEIWIANGPPVSFMGMPYSVRMAVICLSNGELFVHSPISPEKELMDEVNLLGEVKYLTSPNKIHHLFMGDWKELYPNSRMYSSPGLAKRRPDLMFDRELLDQPEPEWANEIDQLIFAGSWVMQEMIFFHRLSKTLILADLIENFDRNWFTGWRKWAAKFAGILEPDGRAPIDYRFSFLGRKSKARASVERMKTWKPDNIIIAHGACYKGNAGEELERAFRWV